MTATRGGPRVGAGRPRGSRDRNSVRVRLIDLLETFKGEWMDIQTIHREYSERFGPVKFETVKRSVYRMLSEAPAGTIKLRRVARPALQGDDWVPREVLEIVWDCWIRGDDE